MKDCMQFNIVYDWEDLGQCSEYITEIIVGWLFWVLRPIETVFQSISGRLPVWEKEERKDRGE